MTSKSKAPKKPIKVTDLEDKKKGSDVKGGLKTEWITSVAAKKIER